jgi:hypothetical protein
MFLFAFYPVLDPYSPKMMDPDLYSPKRMDPDPHKGNADAQHWTITGTHP